MVDRVDYRFGKPFVVAGLSLLLAFPAPLGDCCCAAKAKTAAAPSGHTCCQSRAPRTNDPCPAKNPTCPSSAHSVCKCTGCRAANQPTFLSNDANNYGAAKLTLALAAIPTVFQPVDVSAGIASEQFVAPDAATVPHRILHCSWII